LGNTEKISRAGAKGSADPGRKKGERRRKKKKKSKSNSMKKTQMLGEVNRTRTRREHMNWDKKRVE